MQSVASPRGWWIAALSALHHSAVYRLARRISLGLLTVKAALLVALLALLAVDAAINRAHAAPAPVTSSAQMELDAVLRNDPPAEVALRRSGCAMGQMSVLLANSRRAGIDDDPPASALCVTLLTRLGRDGNLGFVRAPGEQVPRPSIVFDTGFVQGYLKHEPVPANAPTMTALLPLADRCLAESEPNPSLCSAAGQLLGARAAQGEIVTLR